MIINSLNATDKSHNFCSVTSGNTSTYELMFQQTDRLKDVPNPVRNNNDKKPNVEEEIDPGAWNWMNGKYDTENVLSVNKKSNCVTIKVAIDTEEGIIIAKYNITKEGSETKFACEYSNGEKMTHTVDNNSGKIKLTEYPNGQFILYKSNGKREYFEKPQSVEF